MANTTVTISPDQLEAVRNDVLSRIGKLPSLSTVVQEFLELSRRQYFTARDFERVIMKDPALVARLLKVANNGVFGNGRSIKTIPEAIVLIGQDNLRNMVFAVSSGSLMRYQLRSYCFPDKGFWLHSMGVGMTCRAIGEVARDADFGGDAAFVAGLLHDVAKLIIDDFLDPAAGPREVSLEEESRACGFTHCELARHIMDRWKIPPQITEAVRYHHEPGDNGRCRKGAAMVKLADAVCHRWGIGTRSLMDLGEEINLADHAELLGALGIPPHKLEPTLLPLRQKLAKLEDMYDEEQGELTGS